MLICDKKEYLIAYNFFCYTIATHNAGYGRTRGLGKIGCAD